MLNLSKAMEIIRPVTDEKVDIKIIKKDALFSDLNSFPTSSDGNNKKLIVYKKPSPFKADIKGKVNRIKSKRDRSLALRILISMVLLLMAFLFKK